MFKMLMKLNFKIEKPIVFFDTETTGKEICFDKIIEITMIKINTDNSQQIKNFRINPEKDIPPEVTEIHGITNQDVSNQPNFKFYSKEIFDFIKDCDLAGFNIKKFDIALLTKEFERVDITFSTEKIDILDVMKLYHKLEPRKLENAYEKYCGKKLENAHSSQTDTEASIEILNAQLNNNEEIPRTIKEIIEFYEELKNPKVIWIDNEACFNFGKYQCKSLKEVYEIDRNYFKWIIDNDFSQEVKEIVKDALDKKFPKRNENLY